jgi:hypothetical protein
MLLCCSTEGRSSALKTGPARWAEGAVRRPLAQAYPSCAAGVKKIEKIKSRWWEVRDGREVSAPRR